jgi:hypothetical protein
VKAILINAEKKTITELNTLGDRSSICDLIESEDYTIGTYDTETFDTLYVDPIAQSHLPGFTFNGKTFNKIGIIFGSDIEGENTSIQTKIKDLNIKFIAQ